MIRAVAFDMDGLMFDTERLAVEAWLWVADKHGLSMKPDDIASTCGLNAANSRAIFKRFMGEDFDYDNFRREKLERLFSVIDTAGLPVKPGLRELLRALKARGVKVVLATSSERARAERYLREAGVIDYFDALVTGDMIENGKPAPDIYLRAAEVAGEAPADMLALEDAPMGIRSAFAAGMRTIMVPDLAQPTPEIQEMLYARADSLADVYAIAFPEAAEGARDGEI